MLLGLGQETDRGGDGVQVSVFDVSDPTRPVLDARRYLDSSYSAAERDPHAFLWWQPRGLAIIPVQQYSAGAGFDGEVVFRVGADGSLVERGRISQPDQTRPQPQPGPEGQGSGTAPGTPGAEPVRPVDGTMMAPAYSPGIERALIVGGLIYTVSDSGILATDADSLVRVAWLPFPPGQ